MEECNWSTLLDSNGEDSCEFVFTAASLSRFIQSHCKDRWLAVRDVPAFAKCKHKSGESLDQSPTQIFRPPPQSLAFPLLELPQELISLIIEQFEPTETRGLNTLSALSATSKRLSLRAKEMLSSIVVLKIDRSATPEISNEDWDRFRRFIRPRSLRLMIAGVTSENRSESPVLSHQFSFNDLERLASLGKSTIRHIELLHLGLDRRATSRSNSTLSQLTTTLSSLFENLRSLSLRWGSDRFQESPPFFRRVLTERIIYNKLTVLEILGDLTPDLCLALSPLDSLIVLKINGHGILPDSDKWRLGRSLLKVEILPPTLSKSWNLKVFLGILRAGAKSIKSFNVYGRPSDHEMQSNFLDCEETGGGPIEAVAIPLECLSYLEFFHIDLGTEAASALALALCNSPVKTIRLTTNVFYNSSRAHGTIIFRVKSITSFVNEVIDYCSHTDSSWQDLETILCNQGAWEEISDGEEYEGRLNSLYDLGISVVCD